MLNIMRAYELTGGKEQRSSRRVAPFPALCMVVLAILWIPAAVCAGPGTGTATVSPTDDVEAGSTGSWSIQYVAAEDTFTGVIEIVIPDGWSPPQNADSAAAGYVTASSVQPLANPALLCAGSTVTVDVDTLWNGDTVTVVYGDGSIDPGGAATAQTAAADGVTFVVRSDPDGGSPVELIAGSPSLNVIAGPITKLVFVTSPHTFEAGGQSGVMRVEARDDYDNPSAVAADQDIDLSSTSGSGSFVPASTVTMAAGTDTVSFYYSDTTAGTSMVTAAAAGQGWSAAEQQVTVGAAQPTALAVSPESAAAVAGEYTRFTITIEDDFGNPSPAPAVQTITLFPDIGAFYETGNHTVAITSFAISSGDTTAEVDYRNDTAKASPGYFLGFWDNDGVAPSLGFTPVSITIDHAERDVDSSTVAVDTHEAAADSTEFITVTVTVRDAFGNPVNGIGVEPVISGSPDSNFVSPSIPQNSDINGKAVFELRSIRAGSKTVQARIDGVLKTGGETVTFTAGGSYAPASQIAAAPDTVTADGSGTSTVTVIVRDRYDNLVEGSTVVLNVTGSNNTYVPDPPILDSNENGEASFLLRSIVAETKQATATIDGDPTPYSAGIVFVAGSADTGRSEVSADTLAATADGADPLSVRVTVRDAFGNLVSGAVITLEVSGDGDNYNPLSITTGSDGLATFTVTSTKAEEKYIQAVINSVTKPSGVMVDFRPGDPDPLLSQITVAPASAVADGEDNVIVSVIVRDVFNNLVDGSEVVLQVSPPDGIDIDPPANTTDTTGTASFAVRSTVAGEKTVSATADGGSILDTETVGFAAGALSDITITHDGAATAGEPDTVGFDLRDAFGNRVTAFDDTITIYTNSSVLDGNVAWSKWTAQGDLYPAPLDTALYDFNTLDGGRAVLSITARTAELLTVYARYGVVTAQSAAPIVVSPAGVDSISIVSGDGQTAVVGTAVGEDLVVYVEDAYHNAVAGETVTFGVVPPGGSVDTDPGTAGNDSIATTNASGQAACPEWILGTESGTDNNRVRAAISSGSTREVFFAASADFDSLAGIVFNPPTADVTVNAWRIVTAILRDRYGNAVEGEYVTIRIENVPPNGTLTNDPAYPTTYVSSTARTGYSDMEGKVYVRYVAPAEAGMQDTVGALHQYLPADSISPGVYTSSVGTATRLSATVLEGDTSRAGDTFSFEIKAVDDNDNLDTSDTSHIVIAPAGGQFIFSHTPGFTDTIIGTDLVAGTDTIYGSGRAAGTWTIDVTSPPLAPDAFDVTVLPRDSVDHYLITPPPGDVVANKNFAFSVEALDTFSNRVLEANYPIKLRAVEASDTTVTAGGNFSVSTGFLTDGFYTNDAARYDRAEQIRIEVSDTVAGIVRCSETITVMSDVAYRLEKYFTPDTTGVEAGGTRLLRAQVLDRFENAVSDQRVIFLRQAGDGNPDVDTLYTDGAGIARLTYTTGTTAGLNTVKAIILDGDPESLETQLFGITTVPRSEIDYVTLMLPGGTAYEAGQEFTGEISAYDINDNLISTDSTTGLEPVDENGTMTFDSTVVTLDHGIASFTVVDTIKATNRIAIRRAEPPGDTLSMPRWTGVAIDNAAAERLLKVSGDGMVTIAGGDVELVAAVEDRYGNAVDGEGILFRIDSDLGGSPELSDTTGNSGDGFVFTGPDGAAACILTTDVNAGTNTVIASIQTGDADTFNVETVAGDIFSYSVTPDDFEYRAGEQFAVEIVGLDENGNQKIDDFSTIVELGSSTGTTWFSQNPVVLQGGSVSVDAAESTAVDDLRVTAVTQGGGGSGESEIIVIRPALPAGEIHFLSVIPDTVTANNISRSLITTGTMHDSFGNVVEPGNLITVTTSIGKVTSEDADPSSPDTVQRATDLSGVVRAFVASNSVGTATVHFESVEGSASGDTVVVFAPEPSVSYDGYISPSVIVPGDMEQFSCRVRNDSPTGAMLTGSQCTISFGDSPNRYSAPLDGDVFIPGGGTDTLVFSPAAVPAGMAGGNYTPLISLSGTDEYDASYGTSFNTTANAVTVSLIEITDVTARSKIVSRGGSLEVEVKVRNSGGVPVTMNDIVVYLGGDIDFTTPTSWSPALPHTLAPGPPQGYTGIVRIGTGSKIGEAVVSAEAFADAAGSTVSDVSNPAENDTIRVQSEASIAYVTGSLDPAFVTHGEEYAFSADLQNDGEATVILNGDETYLSFDDGADTFRVSLGSTRALAGDGTVTTLAFPPAIVPLQIDPGSHGGRVVLAGTENGGSFNDTIGISDPVIVQEPPVVQYVSGTLDPTQVSKLSSVFFRLDLFNTGGATVVCNPDSTWLTFGTPPDHYRALLDADQGTTITPGIQTTLSFESTQIPDMPNGPYVPELVIVGTANRIRYEASPVIGDTVTVQEPSGLEINSVVLADSATLEPFNRMTADQSRPLACMIAITNNGGATVRIDDLDVRLFLGTSNVTYQYLWTLEDFVLGSETLPGGGKDTLFVVLRDDPDPLNSMSTGTVFIEAEIEGIDLNSLDSLTANTDLGLNGVLIVQSPAVPVVTELIPSVAQVSAGQESAWTVDVAIRNDGGSDIALDLDPAGTGISFEVGGVDVTYDYTITYPDTLKQSGGSILAGGATDTLHYVITRTGVTVGACTIGAGIAGVEINSDRPVSAQSGEPATVDIQSQAILAIVDLIPSQDPVTIQQANVWSIDMVVENNGGSTVTVPGGDPDSTYIRIPEGGGDFLIAKPTGTVDIEEGRTETLTFTVETTGTIDPPGSRLITGGMGGIEINSGRHIYAERTAGDSVLFQRRPDPRYVIRSLSPAFASTGQDISMTLSVQSDDAAHARLILDEDSTRVSFSDTDGNRFEAYLSDISMKELTGGSKVELQFERTTVSPDTGSYTVDIHLAGTENGNAFTADTSSSPDRITIEEASTLSITGIITPVSVTRSLQPPWEVLVVVQNNGEASLDLDLDPAKTMISIEVAGEGDLTSEYTITYPEYLEDCMSDTLSGGQTDTLVFTIDKTDSTSGTARVDAYVTARDINSGIELSDDTKSNGGGGVYLSIQEPGMPVITGAVIEPDTVTSGQSMPWDVTLAVTNAGEAALTLEPGNTYIYSDYALTVPAPPQAFDEVGDGGNTTLIEGETKHLVFTVTPTPMIPDGADLAIKAHIGMTENNRPGTLLEYDTETVPEAQGSVRIQRPSELRTDSLVCTAPRNTFVNTNQRFPLAVQIVNIGEAAVADANVRLVGDGDSGIDNPDLIIDHIGGMSAITDTFFVTAAAASGTETFTAGILSAIDANSGETDIVSYAQARDSMETITIQDPGELTISALEPSRGEVNAGQTIPYWSITVRLLNDGGAPVTLAGPPDADDIRFYSDTGMPLGGYIKVPPTNTGLTIAGGASDSLIYTIERTGDSTGTVTIRARYDWTDDNEPDIEQESVQADTSILVTEPSGVRIVSITSDAWNTDPSANTSIVDTGQPFRITITVSNTGGDDLDSVTVALTSGRESNQSTIALASDTPEIDRGKTGNFIFNVAASDVKGNEILNAEISKAVSRTTGQRVSPIPGESIEYLIIQDPALLSCSASITDPPGAVDGTVSTGQHFYVTASVSNGGEAAVDDMGEITIVLPDGVTIVDLVAHPATRSFQPGQQIVWRLQASGTPSTVADTISVAISTIPNDVNSNGPAALAQEVARIVLVTEESAHIGACALEITHPDGAMDAILSTDQDFIVQASVTPSANAVDVWVELSAPAFDIGGSARRNIPDGDGSPDTVLWNVGASAAASEMLEISSGGTDLNSGQVIPEVLVCGATLPVTVEEKALLSLSARIAAPEAAMDSVVSVDLLFTIEADVTNKGKAGIDTTGARIEIVLPQGLGYLLEERLAVQPFYPDADESVEWNVRAPGSATGPGNIVVRFAGPPAQPAKDVNTGAAAAVDTGSVSIPIQTEAGGASMLNISEEGTAPPYVVPQGARNVPMLRMTVRNNTTSAIGLDTLRVAIERDSPSRWIETVILETKSGVYRGEVTSRLVPIVVGHQYHMEDSEIDTILVLADIAAGAPAGELRIQIARSSDVVFTTVDSPTTRIGVVWGGPNDGDIATHFVSGPMSVMSGNFEEYAHNYPNPFRAGSEPTKISYFLTQDASVRIDIYDLTGMHVWSKDIAAGEPGGTGAEGGAWCEVEWDGRNSNGKVVRNGVYICRIQAGSQSAAIKIAVAK